MKGKYKRRKGQFRPKHSPYSVTSSTSSNIVSNELNLINDSEILVENEVDTSFNTATPLPASSSSNYGQANETQKGDVTCTINTGRVIRPSKSVRKKEESLDDQDDSNQGYRLIHVGKLMEMMSSLFTMHLQHNMECKTPKFAISSSKKWGLGWKCTVKCENCSFLSQKYDLYTECAQQHSPGPKAADINLHLQSALLDSPVGNSGTRALLTKLDIPPPSRTSMQRTAHKVGKKITPLGQSVMKEKIEEIVEIQRARGVEEPRQISISTDARYNTISIAHTKKPGQGASQAVALACETVTKNKYIIGAVVKNKLCYLGAWLRGKGLDVKCPGHVDCTANKNRVVPFSEEEMGRELGDQFALQKVLVKYITTDGDGRMASGIEASLRRLEPLWTCERLADPIHLSKSQFKKCCQANFSIGMFQFRTKSQKKIAQTEFSKDVKARCNKILNKLGEEEGWDYRKITHKLPKVLEVTLECYAGDCSKCRRHSVVCGGGHKNNWWHRSIFLPSAHIEELYMNDNDKKLLREILKMRLSVAAFRLVRMQTDTQQNEALNRSLSGTLPKNNDYSRNAEARVSSLTLKHNLGHEEGTRRKTEILETQLSPRAYRELRKMDDDTRYRKTYENRKDVRKRRLVRRGEFNYDFQKYRRLNPEQKSDYQQGHLDREALQCRGDNSHIVTDHPYNVC